jgi:hypothetical protein
MKAVEEISKCSLFPMVFNKAILFNII